MEQERQVGRIVSVDSLTVYVKLDDDLKSLYKSGFHEIYPVARINSYIIIPVGADRIVAMVNRVQTREETDMSKSNHSIFLTESSRYLSATMIGTIENNKSYVMGVYNYPILDNPVWYVVREDLEKIFDQKKENEEIDYEHDFYLPIGMSPAFPDFKIKINPDKFFGKHAAILGNTGSGKSCTLSSILQSLFHFSYNGKKLKSAHFIIFDTNGEYKNAFQLPEEDVVNPLAITKEGIRIPHWFMNYDDLDYLFEPTSGSQAPILKRAVGLAKSTNDVQEITETLSKFQLSQLNSLLTSLQGNSYTMKNCLIDDLGTTLKMFKSAKAKSNSNLYDELIEVLEELTKARGSLTKNEKGFLNGSVDLSVITDVLPKLQKLIEKFIADKNVATTSENRTLDLPIFYNFSDLLSTYFDVAIREQETSSDRLTEYVSTLKMRMQSFKDDMRISSPLMMETVENIENVLVKFISFLLGDYCKVYDTTDSDIYTEYIKNVNVDVEQGSPSQITILDMALLPSEVLETITGLVGRIVLEFVSRFKEEDRGTMPIVMVLEEAQNYIPEINKKDRTSISRKVFERIAREGRKYGLSLVISSQRPSELSKTVLSQCNSFIIHRLQNPDDQQYIRKLVSSASSEVLNQLPILPQQHAIILGDAVRTPVMARINTASPKPKSDNPHFVENWLNEGKNKEFYHSICDEWETE